MVRRLLFRSGLPASVVALWAGAASAGQITFTGNVENDFPSAAGTYIVTDNPMPQPAGYSGPAVSNPNDVGIASWMTQKGWNTGWNIKDVRVHYDQASDSLAVGVNFFGIAGDADGNGDAGTADPQTSSAGGVDLAHLGGRESIAVGFDLNNDKKPEIMAGVPGDKAQAGPGVDGFTVAKFNGTTQGLSVGFGQALNDYNGGLAFDPDASRPGFEFLIKNFSRLPGLTPELLAQNGYGITVYAGTPDDVVAGEDSLPWTKLSPQAVPEPATLLAWSAVAGAAALGLRRRRRGSL